MHNTMSPLHSTCALAPHFILHPAAMAGVPEHVVRRAHLAIATIQKKVPASAHMDRVIARVMAPDFLTGDVHRNLEALVAE